MDLIQARGETDSQAWAEAAGLDTIEEPFRKPKLDEACRACVDPLWVEAEVAGDSVPRLAQLRRQRIRFEERVRLPERHDVDILRGTADQSEGEQRRAADHNELVVSANARELLRESTQQHL